MIGLSVLLLSDLYKLRPRHRTSLTRSEVVSETKYLSIMFSNERTISLRKRMLTQILFHIRETFLVDKMILLLPEKLATYLNLPTFVKRSCLLTINRNLNLATEKIASVIENQFPKLLKKTTSLFKKKNPAVPKCETTV